MKRTRKQLIIVLFATLLLLPFLPTQSEAEEASTYNGLNYSILGDEAVITGTSISVGSVVIPAEINGYPVTSISSFAFANKQITSISIPDSVVYIGNGVFYSCTQLTQVDLPQSLSYLGNYVFWRCSSLTEIRFPQGIEKVPVGSFYHCSSLRSVFLPDDVTAISVSAFEGCSSLTDVTLSSNLTLINKSAFAGCASLTQITLPSSLEEIRNYAFAGCAGLKTVSIPPSVTTIGTGAFAGCTSMESVSFPKVLPWALSSSTLDVSISNYAFGYTYDEVDGEKTNWAPMKDFTLCGWIDTGAYLYAKGNGFSFTSLGGSHNWNQGVETTAATDTAPGTLTYTCTRCGDTATQAIPSLTETTTPSESNTTPIGTTTQPDTTLGKTPAQSSSDPSVSTIPFSDVPEDSYFAAAVTWAVEQGITNGTGNDTFSPSTDCSRSQIVTFLWRLAGKPEPTISNPFTDVSENAYYYKAVLWAYEKGITTGSSATAFSPQANCSRSQIVTFLWRYKEKPSAGVSGAFTDVASNDFYTTAVYWAVANGITNGTSATTFSPTNTCTRSQAVTFLYRCAK
jgi:hypothetical protein